MEEHKLEIADEVQEEELEVTVYDITSSPNDFNIMTIYSLIDNGVIKMPPFQRNYVWDKKRASKIIESIILGLPIPQVFLYEQGKNSFFVIDGQQRLLSIYFFIKQRFPTAEGRTVLRKYLTGDIKIDNSILQNDEFFNDFKLCLTGGFAEEKSCFNGVKYEELGESKYTFDVLRTIRTVVIKQNEPDDDSAMYEVFNRLNTGGQNLSQQEIRMSLNYSDFYKMLMDLNENTAWRRLLNQKSVDIHFKDIEILLRAFAMVKCQNTYARPMTKFLNSFSRQAAGYSEDDLKKLKVTFEEFLSSCEKLPNDIFSSKTGQFTISLFESVFVEVCASHKEKCVVKESVLELKENEEFSKTMQGDVGSRANVTARARLAHKIIKSI